VLEDLKKIAGGCIRCDLYRGRVNPVFDKGNSKAKIMICGMVPAHDENMAGLPFVGRAGRLLDIILDDVDLTYDDIYITNLVKCFLAAGKALSKEWIDSCRPFLDTQIQLIRPHVIITLGADASKSLANINFPISKLRGNILYLNEETVIIPTFHPSYLLRGGGIKSDKYPDVIGDFELAKKCLRKI
jgi:uracil-DNA glycosylase family 4